jgi:hypothetical protein
MFAGQIILVSMLNVEEAMRRSHVWFKTPQKTNRFTCVEKPSEQAIPKFVAVTSKFLKMH